MKINSLEWSFLKPPELIIDSWSVAATIEVILRVQAERRKDAIEMLLSQSED